MIRFYFHPTPNPAKVALFLEETGLPYEVVPVDTSKGEQHSPAFRAINPNGKVPAIVDTDGPGGVYGRVFDSNAILPILTLLQASQSTCRPGEWGLGGALWSMQCLPAHTSCNLRPLWPAFSRSDGRHR